MNAPLVHNTGMIPDQKKIITIRRAGVDDANLVSVLGATTFYEAYYEQDQPAALASYILESFSPGQVREEIETPGSEFFIIFLDEKAVGYAKLRRDPPAPGVSSENAIELQRFYAISRVWGKGIGEELLNYVLDAAREKGFDMLWLGVWVENMRGRRFYEKQGFRETEGRLEFVYDAGVGINIVMEKRII